MSLRACPKKPEKLASEFSPKMEFQRRNAETLTSHSLLDFTIKGRIIEY